MLVESSGLNRNLEQREARGSMILFVVIVHVMSPRVLSILPRLCSPGHIVADETKSSDLRVRLHDPPQRALGVLGHRVGFVQDDQLERGLRVDLAIARESDAQAQSATMQSTSRRMTAKGGTDDAAPETCLGVSLANVLIFSLTTEIPRSSEALSSKTRARNRSGLV